MAGGTGPTEMPVLMPEPGNIFEQIQLACDDFRRRLKTNAPARIEDYLTRVDESARVNLFQQLLAAEMTYRFQKGEQPNSQEYTSRFPEHTSLIRRALNEASMSSRDGLEQSPASEATIITELSIGGTVGDYELLRELGRGAFGIVYETRHRLRDDRVALKVLAFEGEPDADRLHRFRQEFRKLAEVNHPHLVGMQTLEYDGDSKQWFFTMDLIHGVDFLSYVRPSGELNEDRLRALLPQLVEGISALHAHHIVHRDLKPSNVMVGDDGRLVVLDFGLVAELQERLDETISARSAQFAGTLRYAAPEQLDGRRPAAADWYAMGVMVYEALTGEAPFQGTVADIMVQKKTLDAPQLSNRSDVPADLAMLVDGLLQRDPAGRPDESKIASSLSTASESSQSESDQQRTRSELEDGHVHLVGRDPQLEALEETRTEQRRSKRPLAVWITGRSGEGKSALTEEFLRPLRRRTDTLVLDGRCYDRETVPYKAIESIVDPLISFLRSRENWLSDSDLPQDIAYLAQLFPLLNRVEAIAERSVAESDRQQPERVRARGFHALRELLLIIARRKALIILIDDLQWADADSAQVWVDLFTAAESPPILFLGSYRSDEAQSSAFLQAWEQLTAREDRHIGTRSVTVNPLTRSQSVDLAVIRTGVSRTVMEKHGDELFRNSGGNPYLLDVLLAGFESETSSFRYLSLNEIVARRLSQLPASAGDLLRAVAVFGQPFRAEEVSQVAGRSASEISTLTHMRSERLVRLIFRRDEILVDTYHDKIRETVVSEMAEDQQKKLHQQIAEVIEKGARLDPWQLLESLSECSTPGTYAEDISPRIYDLAHHYSASSDPRAFVYQLLAGEQALAASAIDEARNYYERAERLTPETAGPLLCFRLLLGIGRVHQWGRHPAAAIDAYLRALEVAATPFDRARALTGLGSVHTQSAELDQAFHYFDRGLQELGTRRPPTAWKQLLIAMINGLRALVMPVRWQRWRSIEDLRRAQLISQILEGLPPTMIEKSVSATAESQVRRALFLFRCGEVSEIGAGYASLALVCSFLGTHGIGSVFVRRSRRYQPRLEDAEALGMFHQYYAVIDYLQGNLRRAADRFEAAIPPLLRCGNLFQTLLAQHMIRHVRSYNDTAASEYAAAQKVLSLARELENEQCLCWGYYDVASALARMGQLALASEYMDKAKSLLTREAFHQTEAIRGSCDSYVQLQMSEFVRGRESANAAWRTAKSAVLFSDFPMLCLPMSIEATAGPRWATDGADSDPASIRKTLLRARLLYRSLPNHQPHLQRVIGRARFALGRKRRAVRHFEEAVRLSQQKSMDYQRAKSLLDLAAVKEDGREENRAEAIRLLQETESVIPRAESWLLGDQYDEAVIAPEFDLRARGREYRPLTSGVMGDP